jgi:hypothetical protein
MSALTVHPPRSVHPPEVVVYRYVRARTRAQNEKRSGIARNGDRI